MRKNLAEGDYVYVVDDGFDDYGFADDDFEEGVDDDEFDNDEL